jgi:hypothetical protein
MIRRVFLSLSLCSEEHCVDAARVQALSTTGMDAPAKQIELATFVYQTVQPTGATSLIIPAMTLIHMTVPAMCLFGWLVAVHGRSVVFASLQAKVE